MIFCAVCGAKQNELTKFCSNCGKPLESNQNEVKFVDPNLEMATSIKESFIQRHRLAIGLVGVFLLLLLMFLGLFSGNGDGNGSGIGDCSSLATSVIKLSAASKNLVSVIDVTNPTEVTMPTNLIKDNWTTQLSCRGDAVLSNGTSQQEDFQLVTDPNSQNLVEWQPTSLNS